MQLILIGTLRISGPLGTVPFILSKTYGLFFLRKSSEHTQMNPNSKQSLLWEVIQVITSDGIKTSSVTLQINF
jgi:hypothetical protein